MLRGAGFVLHTLPEVFGGEDAAQQAKDTEWIAVAGSKGWAALSKNHRIRHNQLERDALVACGVPLFTLATGQLGHAEMAGMFLLAMGEIFRVVGGDPGGGLWMVYRDGRVLRRWPAELADR